MYQNPGMYNAGRYGRGMRRPDNYLVLAILATIFCCLPFGIVSVIFAGQVNPKWDGGDHAGAWRSSSQAKTWLIVSAVCGVVGGILYLFIRVAVGDLGGGAGSS